MNVGTRTAFALVVLVSTLLLLASRGVVAAVKVVVDNTQPHQVIEGFGASHLSLFYVGLGDTLTPNLRTRAIDAIYKQVGISMGNIALGLYETPAGFTERANDDDDPFHFNARGFNWQASDVMKAKVVDLAQPLGFDNYYLAGNINTRWEMTWMEEIRKKDYNRYLDEAAEAVAAPVIRWRDRYGIVPRYYMLFNEPLSGNKELLNGTVQDVVDIVKRAGARLRREGFSAIKFVVPAEESEALTLKVARRLVEDADARQYVGAIAYHPYPADSPYANIPNLLRTSGAGKPDADRVSARQALRDLGKPYGIPVWMTEVTYGGVHPLSFDGLRGRAIHIHDELVYADASAYFGMSNMWDTTSQEGHFSNKDIFSQEGHIVLIENATEKVYITGMGYAIGHYARWIKRGAVRIEATSSDPLLQVTAFRDDAQKRLVLVLINNAATSSSLEIALKGTDSFGAKKLAIRGEQSTAAAPWAPLSPFASATPTTLSLTVPALSVTTLSAQPEAASP